MKPEPEIVWSKTGSLTLLTLFCAGEVQPEPVQGDPGHLVVERAAVHDGLHGDEGTSPRGRVGRPGGRPPRTVQAAANASQSGSCCTPDVIGIIMSIFMQDGPFLVLRMVLIFKYSVFSYTNMFFTCKNTIVVMLLMYRLVVIQVPIDDLITSVPSPTIHRVQRLTSL